MKAIVCTGYGPVENLQLWDCRRRELKDDQVRIEVHAAGANFPDSLKIQGRYQVRTPTPYTPGSEIAGTVLEVGSNVSGITAGDRVIGVMPADGGGWAQEVTLDASRTLKMPDTMSFVEGAALPVVYGTALYALKQRAELRPAETLLVLGAAGGVGLAAVQIGRAMQAHVIAAASTSSKLELALQNGAHEVINYAEERLSDAVRRLTGDQGANVVFDPVGGDAFDEATRCVSWLGRLMVIGFVSGRIAQLPANRPLLNNWDLRGVRYDIWRDSKWSDCASNFKQLFEWYEKGLIKPRVTRTYALADAAQALNAITQRQITGKVVLLPQM